MTLSLMRFMNGSASSYDSIVERATSEENTTEDWSLILSICDRVNQESDGAKECLSAIIKRLNWPIPCVTMQCLTLLDSLVKNCGKKFHLEICSRDFETELQRLVSSKNHPKIVDRTKLMIKKWAHEFKDDPQLSLIPALYGRLKAQGHDFSNLETTKPRKISLSKLPADVVTSNQEEEDIAKAIELSLKETSSKSAKSSTPAPTFAKVTSNGTSLYNNLLDSVKTNTKAPMEKEVLKARALYDFEAAEDNELTFKAGEIIIVTDNSDANWWKGSNHRGEGLFPANFVSTDLNAEFEPSYKAEKKVQFNEEVKVKVLENEKTEPAKIDENKIDRLLHLLHEADPQSDKCDSDELLTLEEQCISMMPLIDQKIESIDKRHAVLTGLNHQLNQALSLYHQLMKESMVLEQQQQQQVPMSAYQAGGQVQQQYSNMAYIPPAPPGVSQPSMPYDPQYSYYMGNASQATNPPPGNYIGPQPPMQSYYPQAAPHSMPSDPSNYSFQSTMATSSQAGGGQPMEGNPVYNSMPYSPQVANQTPNPPSSSNLL